MDSYQFYALDSNNHKTRGVIQADSLRAARAQLRERGLHPLEVAANGSRSSGLGSIRSLRNSELVLITRQWSALLLSGLTVEQTLSALAEQAERESTRQVLLAFVAMCWPGILCARHSTIMPRPSRRSIVLRSLRGKSPASLHR